MVSVFNTPAGRVPRRSGVFRVRHQNGAWRKIKSVLADVRDDAAISCFVAVAPT